MSPARRTSFRPRRASNIPTRASALGGVDHEKGIAWRRGRPGSTMREGETSRSIMRRDRLWRAAAAGQQLGLGLCPGRDRRRPIATARSARFYFGSFRNNYVDNRPEKRYRELESFPGFEIDQIAARKFGKLTGEINLPPIRFAEIGTPAFFLSYARPALFGGAMLLALAGRQKLPAVQTSARRSTSASPSRMRLPMVFSVGVGRGFRRQGHRRTRPSCSLR